MAKKNKPVGGYPSIKKAVYALIGQGLSREEVIEKLGITNTQFNSAYGYGVHVALPDYVTEALQPYADARKMRMSMLVRYILETIVDENLIKSVLDDEVDDLTLISKKLRNEFVYRHYKCGMSKRDIAKKFNISMNHVTRIYAGERDAYKTAAS